jgi:hypothetical protein
MQLTSEIAKLDLRGAVQRSLGARAVELSETVRRMEASVPTVMVSLESAIERYERYYGVRSVVLIELFENDSRLASSAVDGNVAAAGVVVVW